MKGDGFARFDMKMKPRLFVVSAMLAAYLLYLAHAPYPAIAAGIALAAFFTFRKRAT